MQPGTVQPGNDVQSDGLFDGSEQVINMIRDLYVRRSKDDPLPILSLVRRDLDSHPGFLAYVSKRLLEGTNPCVPHVHIDLGAESDPLGASDAEPPEVTQDDVIRVRGILLRLARKLEESEGGRFRLDRFRDVAWLMSQKLPDESTRRRHAELRKLLRRRARGQTDDPARDVAAQLPGWVRWLLLLKGLLTPLWYRARHSGRAWPISGRYRWFLRQPNLAPGNGSFIDLAVKLTVDESNKQVPEQVLRIMVNSLLEDLRAAFRGRGFFKKYRTTYPILFLDHITRANGGYSLLRVVNDIRNDTGLPDPILLVTSSKQVPLRTPSLNRRTALPEIHSAVDSEAILGTWKNSIIADQQSRSNVAWYLFIGLPEPADGVTRQRINQRLSVLQPFTFPRVPTARNRAVTMTLVVVLLGIATGGYITLGLDDSYHSCESGFTWLGVQSRNADIVRIGEECIGVTDGSNAALFPSDPLSEQVRTVILNQNREAELLHQEQPVRPLITLVFVGALNTVPNQAKTDSLNVEREQLAGLAAAQRQQLAKRQESDPLVRVLIANAGQRTAHGVTVAEMIGQLANRDRSIVAAIGFDESRRNTMDTIRALASVGLPVVAATLSADELAENSMYFQVSPQNRRQAEVVAAYSLQYRDSRPQNSGRPLASRVRVYFSDDEEDIYSKNLTKDLTESFERRGFTVEYVRFTPAGNSSAGNNPGKPSDRFVTDSKAAGRDACGFDGVVFYAARPLPDFQGFIGGVSDGCKNSPPLVIAGDDTTKYVANENIRTLNTVPFSYVSFAVSPEIPGITDTHARGFYNLLDRMFPDLAKKGRSLDGHAALTYDAAYSVITAAGYLATDKIPVTGGTLWWALASITDDRGANKKYDAITGAIDFGGEVSRRVPLNKPISILQVEGGVPNANQRAFCGNQDDPATQPWCPFDN